ncbi:MAG: FMN-binding protein [Oceanococcus sp.]
MTDLIWALVTISKYSFSIQLALLSFWACSASFAASAAEESVYLSRDAFVAQAFSGEAPQAQLIWLSGELREQVSALLGHPPRSARLRYWQVGKRSAWILDEIGKERPITAGFVIEDSVLRQVEILIYRESRGWEIRNRFFTEQFANAQLADNQQLDRKIDNITGATLSVAAVRRLAQLALLLDQQLQKL